MADDELVKVKAALKRIMADKGIAAKPLSKAAGLGETAVRDFLDGSDIRLGTLRKLAHALDSSLAELVGAEAAPLTGRIGAGGSIVFEEEAGREAPRISGMPKDVEALEVIGDSMLPKYSEGDLVYISRSHDGIDEEALGEYCAVRLTTGETYLKILARGARPGFYTLRSLNAGDMEDVEVDWATPVIASIPRAARRRLGF